MATITDYARMCKAHERLCVKRDCPMSKANNGFKDLCEMALRKHPSEASAIIDKWCAEHPQKTYKQDFMEKFPNAKIIEGRPIACAHDLYGDVITCANQKCKDCWNAVIPDEAEKEEV